MTLHIKLFMSFLSLASRSPESYLCCTSFLSPLDTVEQLVTAPQLQVYKPGLQSVFSLALLSLIVFMFSVSSVHSAFNLFSLSIFSGFVLYLNIFQGLFSSTHKPTQSYFLQRYFVFFKILMVWARGLCFHPVKLSVILFFCLSLKGTAAMDWGKTAWV